MQIDHQLPGPFQHHPQGLQTTKTIMSQLVTGVLRNGDPGVIGSIVHFNFRPHTVVGVASPRFLGSQASYRADAWLPFEPFKARSDLPTESVAMFSWVSGIGWSDHLSFWKEGYPAIMVTDTALYRTPYYHTAEDTPDKLDYGAMTRATKGLFHAFCSLAVSDPP